MDWFVYHSTAAMGQPYHSLEESVVYSTKEQPKLGLGDTIWVIEGPGEFALVDAFRVTRTDAPSRVGPYRRFKIKVIGDRSLLQGRHVLSLDQPWFRQLHASYITKQRFFLSLAKEPDMLAGLRSLCAGVS